MGRRNFPSPLALSSVTLLVTHWGRVGLTGIANVRSQATSLTEVPIINGQTRKVVRDTLSTKQIFGFRVIIFSV